MLPQERSLLEELKGQAFAIVGVNSDSKEELQQLVKDGTTTWRKFTDEQKDGRRISDDWGVKSWPTLYILDHKGVIRHKGLYGEDIDEAIKTLVKEVQ